MGLALLAGDEASATMVDESELARRRRRAPAVAALRSGDCAVRRALVASVDVAVVARLDSIDDAVAACRLFAGGAASARDSVAVRRAVVTGLARVERAVST